MKIKTTRKKTKLQQENTENDELSNVLIAAQAAQEKKGENVLLLYVGDLTIISDYFLIITAKSFPQIQAISSFIEEKLKVRNKVLLSKEGFVQSNWIVLDYGNIVVHIMHEKERNYYKLEKFWSNATFIDNKVWNKAS